MSIFEQLESEVRAYSRSFPVVFETASGAFLRDEGGREYLDFLCGAGSMNYGHNHPVLRQALTDYLNGDGIVQGLDLRSSARRDFLETFHELILRPRELEYRLQFPGPTGANAVEAALKLARKVTGRSGIVAFTGAFHGVTAGALEVTAHNHYRQSSTLTNDIAFFPYDGFAGMDDTIAFAERMIEDATSGVGLPAAVIVETIQGEGGVVVASDRWLQDLERLCRRHGCLLIVDDIQAGCGRTGAFFSFEQSGITPDMVTLAKSLSGYGLPLSLLLLRPELDVWEAGEHNGTFRANNPAIVTATATLKEFWENDSFARTVLEKGARLRDGLLQIRKEFPGQIVLIRGRGLFFGAVCADGLLARSISATAFERGLIVETSGRDGSVIKFLPPLNIDVSELDRALAIFQESVAVALQSGPGLTKR